MPIIFTFVEGWNETKEGKHFARLSKRALYTGDEKTFARMRQKKGAARLLEKVFLPKSLKSTNASEKMCQK